TVARSWSSASAIEWRAVFGRDLDRSPRLRVDEDERLVRGDEERVVRHLEGGELESHARPPDLRDPDADLELVVEPGGGQVLDVVSSHHELAERVPVEEAERAEPLRAREVEVRVVAPVVDDTLRVCIRERDARPDREGVLVAHERITVSTSSRFSSISSCEV